MATRRRKQRVGALDRKALLALSAKQRQRFHGRILIDERFRKLLLSNPAKGFRQLGLKLSAKYERLFLRTGMKIKAAGKRSDALVDLKMYGLIPLGHGGRGKSEAKKKKPKRR
jgi:hypothetical protein